nr:hypothetical protein [Cystobacter fuscus]
MLTASTAGVSRRCQHDQLGALMMRVGLKADKSTLDEQVDDALHRLAGKAHVAGYVPRPESLRWAAVPPTSSATPSKLSATPSSIR